MARRMGYTEFRRGDIVKCLETIEFCDGTKHTAGQEIKVTKETEAYFNAKCNNNAYSLIGHCS